MGKDSHIFIYFIYTSYDTTQECEPELDTRHLQGLSLYFISHSSIVDMITWEKDPFGKPLSST